MQSDSSGHAAAARAAANSQGFARYPFSLVRPGGAFSRRGMIAAGCAVVVLTALYSLSRVRSGEPGPAAIALVLGIEFALICFGLVPQRAPRAPFRYLNGIVLTRAERAPADSWVHVAPTRPVRLPLVLACCLAALGLLAAAVFAGLQAFGAIPILNPDTSDGGLFLATVFCLVSGGVTAWVAWLLVWRSVRGGSFGTRPSGVALGETGVAVRVPGRDVEIPWTHIRSVEAIVAPLGRREHVPMIRLALLPGGAVHERVQLLAADGYTVPTDALFTALRWYHANPDRRWELGRVEAVRRIERWHEDALRIAA